MVFPEHAPELVIGPYAQAAIDNASDDEQIEIYRRIFSLLRDPSVDYRYKSDLPFFPYSGMGVRQMRDAEYLITYREAPNGDVHVLTVHKISELPRVS